VSSRPNKAYFGESLPPSYLPDDWILLQDTIWRYHYSPFITSCFSYAFKCWITL